MVPLPVSVNCPITDLSIPSVHTVESAADNNKLTILFCSPWCPKGSHHERKYAHIVMFDVNSQIIVGGGFMVQFRLRHFLSCFMCSCVFLSVDITETRASIGEGPRSRGQLPADDS